MSGTATKLAALALGGAVFWYIKQRKHAGGASRAASGDEGATAAKKQRASTAERAHGNSGDGARPYIIGVAGASGSGKTTVCTAIVESLEDQGQRVAVIPSDAYYKGLEGRDPTTYNFDVPAALDFDLLVTQLQALKRGETIQLPMYDFKTHSRMEQSIPIGDVDVVIVEGILIFAHTDLLRMFDMRLFAMEDADTCLVRRLRRDIVDRGRSVESVLHQYEAFVKPAFQSFVHPSMMHADVILPRAGRNSVALKLLLREIRARCLDSELLARPADASL